MCKKCYVKACNDAKEDWFMGGIKRTDEEVLSETARYHKMFVKK